MSDASGNAVGVNLVAKDKTGESATPSAKKQTFIKDFFESIPPNLKVHVADLAKRHTNGPYAAWYSLKIGDIELYCESELCQGKRFFQPSDQVRSQGPIEAAHHYLKFVCRNCNKTEKTFAFTSILDSDCKGGEVMKVGEIPPFGPNTPSRLISLIGPDRDFFLQGRRAESQGMGIAAFAYYRRVVESQKKRIFDQIIRVAEKIKADPAVIADLKVARGETQFSKAVDAIKHGIPQTLLISGHNPLALLHSALSEGLHAQTDQECLDLATSIRLVLTDLVERMELALREQDELNSAVNKLLQTKAPRAATEDDAKSC